MIACTGPASVATVDMNDINPSLEVGNLPTNMDTTDELVPTLDVKLAFICQTSFNLPVLLS